jgi:hypothetical protein
MIVGRRQPPVAKTADVPQSMRGMTALPRRERSLVAIAANLARKVAIPQTSARVHRIDDSVASGRGLMVAFGDAPSVKRRDRGAKPLSVQFANTFLMP